MNQPSQKKINMNRILTGYISRCICCNRPMSDNECTRTYPNSNELIATCNSCLSESQRDSLPSENVLQNTTEGLASPLYTDSHSKFYYSYFDN